MSATGSLTPIATENVAVVYESQVSVSFVVQITLVQLADPLVQQALSQGIADTFDVPVADVFILGISSTNATDYGSDDSGARMLTVLFYGSTIDFVIHMPSAAASQNVMHQLSNQNATATSLFVAQIMVAAVAADTTGILATAPPTTVAHVTTAVVVVTASPPPLALRPSPSTSMPVWEIGAIGGAGGLALIAALAVVGHGVARSSQKKRLAASLAAAKEGEKAAVRPAALGITPIGAAGVDAGGIGLPSGVEDGEFNGSPTALPIRIAPLAVGICEDDEGGDRYGRPKGMEGPENLLTDRVAQELEDVDNDDDDLCRGDASAGEPTRRSSVLSVVSVIADTQRSSNSVAGGDVPTSRVAPIIVMPLPTYDNTGIDDFNDVAPSPPLIPAKYTDMMHQLPARAGVGGNHGVLVPRTALGAGIATTAAAAAADDMVRRQESMHTAQSSATGYSPSLNNTVGSPEDIVTVVPPAAAAPAVDATAGIVASRSTATTTTSRDTSGEGLGRAVSSALKREDIVVASPHASSSPGATAAAAAAGGGFITGGSSQSPKVQQLRAPLRPSHSVSSSGVGSSLLPPVLPTLSLRKLHKQGTFGLGTALVAPPYSTVVPGPAMSPNATDAAIENLLVPAARHARRPSLSSVHAAYRRMYADAELARIIDNLLPTEHAGGARHGAAKGDASYVGDDAESVSTPSDVARVLGFESAYTEGGGPDAQSQVDALTSPQQQRGHSTLATPATGSVTTTASGPRRGSVGGGHWEAGGIVDFVTHRGGEQQPPLQSSGAIPSIRRLSVLSVSAARRNSVHNLVNSIHTLPATTTTTSVMLSSPTAGADSGKQPWQQQQQQVKQGQWASADADSGYGGYSKDGEGVLAPTGAIIEELRNAFKYDEPAAASMITVAAAAVEQGATGGAGGSSIGTRGRARDRSVAPPPGSNSPRQLQRYTSGQNLNDSPVVTGSRGGGSVISAGRRAGEGVSSVGRGVGPSARSSSRRLSILRTAQTALSPTTQSSTGGTGSGRMSAVERDDSGAGTVGPNRIPSISPERVLVARPQGHGHVTVLNSRGPVAGRRALSSTRRSGSSDSMIMMDGGVVVEHGNGGTGGGGGATGGGGGRQDRSPGAASRNSGLSSTVDGSSSDNGASLGSLLDRVQQRTRHLTTYTQAPAPASPPSAAAAAAVASRAPPPSSTTSFQPNFTASTAATAGRRAGSIDPTKTLPSFTPPPARSLLRLPSGKVLNPVLQNSPYRPVGGGTGTSTRRLSLGSSSRHITGLAAGAAGSSNRSNAAAPLSTGGTIAPPLGSTGHHSSSSSSGGGGGGGGSSRAFGLGVMRTPPPKFSQPPGAMFSSGPINVNHMPAYGGNTAPGGLPSFAMPGMAVRTTLPTRAGGPAASQPPPVAPLPVFRPPQ